MPKSELYVDVRTNPFIPVNVGHLLTVYGISTHRYAFICRDGRVLVFVEVRQRSRSDYGGAGASITISKQRRIVLAARHYLAGQPECDCRFDCVLIEGERLEWLKDAFTADA